jgi:hypothetical protein
MIKNIYLSGICLLLLCFNANAQKTAYTLPEVNKIFKEIHIYISVELDDSAKTKTGFINSHYFTPLLNYIDYNVIGKGQVAMIHDDELREFILKNIREGKSLDKIGKDLIGEYIRLGNSEDITEEKEDNFHIGGYFSTGVELDQAEDGEYEKKIELNQLRLYFASHFNTKATANKVSVFAEYNPVPEEVIHQVDKALITKNNRQDSLLAMIQEGEAGEKVPFERLFVNIKNVAASKINLTLGQFRTPFGFWSDYTSHRNFSSAKNNLLVNGFALKKIETGLKLDCRFSSNLEMEAAIVYGRMGRTAPLYREDFDSKKDLVTHITYTKNKLGVGASAYLAEFSFDKRTAYGIDINYRMDKLLLSAEYVVQRNSQLSFNAPNIGEFINQLSSSSAYLQYDYEINNKLHLYGLYDFWKLKADGQTVNRVTYKIFQGVKYFINPKTRWTILEYGHMFFEGFDKGQNHLSTHLEINF